MTEVKNCSYVKPSLTTHDFFYSSGQEGGIENEDIIQSAILCSICKEAEAQGFLKELRLLRVCLITALSLACGLKQVKALFKLSFTREDFSGQHL